MSIFAGGATRGFVNAHLVVFLPDGVLHHIRKTLSLLVMFRLPCCFQNINEMECL